MHFIDCFYTQHIFILIKKSKEKVNINISNIRITGMSSSIVQDIIRKNPLYHQY